MFGNPRTARASGVALIAGALALWASCADPVAGVGGDTADAGEDACAGAACIDVEGDIAGGEDACAGAACTDVEGDTADAKDTCAGAACADVGHDTADASADADGATPCTPTGALTCCDGALCLLDSCGVAAAPVAACAFGCSDGACLACDAPCGAADCGDDGCGRSCGTCEGDGEACVGGRCACVPDDHSACCALDGGGVGVCRYDSCGGVEALVAPCPSGCDGGRCLACAPECGDRVCGDDGCGGSCGACARGAVCGDDGACACVPAGVACCDGGLCEVDSCGVVGAVVAACPGGCDEGGCHGCAADCRERRCGDDGCGGSCGACGAPGEVCDPASGACVCAPRAGVACCEGGICWVDGCGGIGDLVTPCPFGCASGRCRPCEADCGERVCGDDGCGGSCGACEGTSVTCEAGVCVCTGEVERACCGADVCAVDACGVAGAVLESCARGCEDGACKPCVPACADAECGPDGCGGSCGGCDGGAVCTAQRRCACTPTVLTGCCGDALCALDSCGGVGAPVEGCPWGCEGGACLPCPASCDGVECGDDGCGGSCGGCGADEVCLSDGACCAPACDGRACDDDGCGGVCGTCAAPTSCDGAGACVLAVEGRLLRERREPNAALTGLTAVAVVPVAGLEVAITAGSTPLGTVVTAEDGRFRLGVGAVPTAAIRATLAASVPNEDGLPFVTLVDTQGVSFPADRHKVVTATRPWAWSVTAAQGVLDLGTTTVTDAQGAGALEILRAVRGALDRVLGLLGLARRDAPSLAVVWGPSTTPPCLSCYFPADWGPLVLQGPSTTTFDRFIWLSGAAYAPHQWTPSLILHELGHYVLDVFSLSPNEGGSHSWSSRVSPGLAWSEGHATFFAQVELSAMAGAERPRFFGIQLGTNYWVDLEHIGTPPAGDDASLPSLSFPPPSPLQSMAQLINEAVVAAILWDAWDEGVAPGEADTLAFGDTGWLVLRSARYRDATLNRGHSAPDLVDWLDAVRCLELATGAELATVLFGFPYDDAPSCPSAP